MDDIASALSHLLPTVPCPHPRSLVAAASEIRDQSRSKLKLRPEEEPSRTWFATWVAAERMATVLNLPPPKLNKHTPITIPQKVFKRLLVTFRSSVPEQSEPRRTKIPDVSREITQLCTKVQSTVSQSYLAKTVEPLLIRHPRRESHHAIIAATFLLCGNRKITPGEKRKVIDAFDERFSGKELTDWIKVIGKELEEEKWFEKHPQTVERKHKDEKRVLAKNISGVGIMVLFGEKQAEFEAWRDSIMRQVEVLESVA